jgi:two-component system nitrogen regulation response regulator NtrX
LELVDAGTLFFDEIGDMSLKTQSKILRVLQEQQFQRVGGSRTLSVNVRVIASTNKDLEKEIEKGTFREDIYYRLNVIPIEVPPLRNRFEDIPQLVEIFLNESAQQNRSKKKEITREAIDLLCKYSWPGNVRELKNLVERLAIMVGKEVIDKTEIPAPYNPDSKDGRTSIETQLFLSDSLKDAKKIFEKEFIQRKLMQNQNNITKTAKSMGVEKNYLHKRIKTLKLSAKQETKD